ncbi:MULTISPECIES: hypothetical protein [unclassified Rhizobium]|uniref:hypothetical protein n=1 Tax=unclassified Rhizobium TaxID=2613769 RepID=UPI00288AB13D|nr:MULTISPECIES: hypothetical protein [unclassified Rhizobium]
MPLENEPDARRLCAEFEIVVIPANEMPVPGQTRAIGTICRIMAKHGEPHARLVLSTLAETKNNQGLITETSLWAASDLVQSCSDWIDKDLSSWYAAWDAIPLGYVLWHVQELSGKSHMRHALAGAVYLMLVHYSSGKKANRDVSYSFLRRVQKAEGDLSVRQLGRQEAIEMCRELIRVKGSLPVGDWIPWVRKRSGVSYSTALKYMQLARSA